ncbi:MAG: hypothetical protein IAA72_07840 [Spirochaetes bacterium]|uniref:Uncharacterized protein n=1 Tax=Candidatus Ornithospirochaeta stercoravium TaxID=2840897 RepID=A0A9D9IC96_9SPIO|nr:hypothetical protein [Candidatus Ornithospirochaeta stercoravium]
MDGLRIIRRYSERPARKKALPLDADILNHLRNSSSRSGFTYSYLKNEFLYGDERPRKLKH